MVHLLNGLQQDDVLWRYMSVDKLESLLSTEALHFAPVEQFEDEWEGAITAIEQGRRAEWMSRALSDLEGAERGIASLSKAFRELAVLTKVNCWHAAVYESAAMWALYVKENKGVAILSTVGHIAKSLREFRLRPEYAEEDFLVGRVQYLDYDREEMNNYCVQDSMLNPFFFKREHFEHEREVRIALPLRKAHEWGVAVPKAGILVPVDLPELVQEVRFASGTAAQLREDITRAVRDKGLKCPVAPSVMDRKPAY